MVRAERSWPEGHKSRCRAEDRGATFPLTNILAFPKAFSADVVANVLDKLQLDGIRKASEKVIGTWLCTAVLLVLLLLLPPLPWCFSPVRWPSGLALKPRVGPEFPRLRAARLLASGTDR
jgi:hypothetical protein